MNYCELSGSLVRSFSRSQKSVASSFDGPSLAAFPPYEHRNVQEITRECSELYSNLFEINQRIQALSERSGEPAVPTPSDSASLLLFYTAIQRNKRCVLAYLNARIQTLKAAMWEIGGSSAALLDGLDQSKSGVMDGDGSASTASAALSKEEMNFLHEYEKCLLDYQRSSGVDVHSELQPPASLLVEVRVLKGVGVVETSSGPVNFEVNSTHLLRREDAELFIRQGILKQTEQEK